MLDSTLKMLVREKIRWGGVGVGGGGGGGERTEEGLPKFPS